LWGSHSPRNRLRLREFAQMACYTQVKFCKSMSKLTPGWQRTSVLESVFDQLSDALVLYDPEFRITGVNRAAEKLFGMSSEEMLGKHCQEIFRCSVCEPNCGMLVAAQHADGVET